MADTPKKLAPSEPARRLVEAIDRSGLTKTAVAERLGVHNGTLSRYLNRRMRIPADVLMHAEELFTDASTRERATLPSPLHMPSYWQGRMVGVSELLQNAINVIQAADNEVRGLVESEILLSGRESGAVKRPKITAEEAIAAVEASGLADARPRLAAASDE